MSLAVFRAAAGSPDQRAASARAPSPDLAVGFAQSLNAAQAIKPAATVAFQTPPAAAPAPPLAPAQQQPPSAQRDARRPPTRPPAQVSAGPPAGPPAGSHTRPSAPEARPLPAKPAATAPSAGTGQRGGASTPPASNTTASAEDEGANGAAATRIDASADPSVGASVDASIPNGQLPLPGGATLLAPATIAPGRVGKPDTHSSSPGAVASAWPSDDVRAVRAVGGADWSPPPGVAASSAPTPAADPARAVADAAAPRGHAPDLDSGQDVASAGPISSAGAAIALAVDSVPGAENTAITSGAANASNAFGLARDTSTQVGHAATHEARIGVALTDPGFAPALGASLAVLVRDGVQHARLQLHPAEMGPITVQIVLDGASARVDFHAEVAATRAALEAALPNLAGALRESGLTLTGGGVFQQAPGQQQGDANAQRQAASPRWGAGGSGGSGGGQAAGAMRAPLVQRGLVDLVA